MNDTKVHFYNMLIHLVRNNRIYEENVAIRNIWEKDGNIFFDIYFYRRRKSYIFDSVFIHDITDLSNEKYYKDIKSFVKDFKLINQDNVPLPETKIYAPAIKLFENIAADIEIMLFVSMCEIGKLLPVKEKIIIEYIRNKIPQSANLSHQYISGFLKSLNYNEKIFYNALNQLKRKPPEAAEHLLNEVIKIALSDGKLHYKEKWFLAEIWEQLRQDGLLIEDFI